MSRLERKKNASWLIHVNDDGTSPNSDAQLAVLMDIRDELQQINNRLHCAETLAIPRVLKQIQANTKKRKYTRRKQ